MAKRAEALGANTFAFFTRNPRGGSAKPIEEADIAAFHAECARAGIDRLVSHAPYTLNPCAAKPQVAEFARMAFSDDLQRMERTPGQFTISTPAATSVRASTWASRRSPRCSMRCSSPA